MIFNRENIKNRTVLARCCYADMILDMMEASASGDTELQLYEEEGLDATLRNLSDV